MNRKRFQAIASLGFPLILILGPAWLARARTCWSTANICLVVWQF
jgi:hypothetical protein